MLLLLRDAQRHHNVLAKTQFNTIHACTVTQYTRCNTLTVSNNLLTLILEETLQSHSHTSSQPIRPSIALHVPTLTYPATPSSRREGRYRGKCKAANHPCLYHIQSPPIPFKQLPPQEMRCIAYSWRSEIEIRMKQVCGNFANKFNSTTHIK